MKQNDFTCAFPGKSVTDQDIKQLLRILVKALESFNDIVLLEALVMCITRLQPLLRPVSLLVISREIQ
jgi:hypothetical protein